MSSTAVAFVRSPIVRRARAQAVTTARTEGDVRLFGTTFLAGFLAVMLYLA